MKKSKSDNNPINIVNLWERLELKLEKEGKSAGFITRIEDIKNNTFTVENPIRISGELDLMVGQQLEVTANKLDAAYIFNVIVSDIDTKNENLTVLQPASDIKRTQRRKFVRIDIAGNIAFKTIAKDESGKPQLSLDKKGELLNISAGGILIVTGQQLKNDDILLMNFWMKNSQRLENILGIIKRVEQSSDSDNPDNEFIVGIEFLSKEKSAEKLNCRLEEILPFDTNYFNEALQQAIVQFVYKQQVEQRNKKKANL